jgi:hypothetical protein
VARLIKASVDAFERHDDQFGAGTARTIDAVGLLAAGELDRCVVAAEAARGHALRCGDRFVQGRVEWVEGLLADAAGDVVEAYRHVERGLLLLDQLGMGQEVTAQAGLLIAFADRRGEHELAAQWRAFVAGRTGGLARHDVLLMASARNGEGLHARQSGELDRARAAHLDALEGYKAAGVMSGVAFTESCLGFLALETGQTDEALAHHVEALGAAMASGEDAALALALDGAAASLTDDRPQVAAVLLGAGSRLWDGSTSGAGASHRGDVGACTARLRARLGAAAFTTAHERGTRGHRDEMVALARSELRELTSVRPQRGPAGSTGARR